MGRIMNKATTRYTRTATTKSKAFARLPNTRKPARTKGLLLLLAWQNISSSEAAVGEITTGNLSILRSGQKVDTVNEKQASEQKGLTPCNTARYKNIQSYIEANSKSNRSWSLQWAEQPCRTLISRTQYYCILVKSFLLPFPKEIITTTPSKIDRKDFWARLPPAPDEQQNGSSTMGACMNWGLGQAVKSRLSELARHGIRFQ